MAYSEEMKGEDAPEAHTAWRPNPALLTESDLDFDLPRLELHFRIVDGVFREAPEPVNPCDFEGNHPDWSVEA